MFFSSDRKGDRGPRERSKRHFGGEYAMTGNGTDTTDMVKNTIYKACLYLDDQKWSDWLDLCDKNFQYTVKAYSPEIGRDMIYMSGSRDDLATLTQMLPKHNTDHSPLKRHATVYAVDMDKNGETATAVTSFVAYQTMFDGINSHIDAGETRLFLVGRYIDKLRFDGGQVKFVEREVRLENRRLDKGSHWPI
jgi:methanesulfonate monooxygenase small subunit